MEIQNRAGLRLFAFRPPVSKELRNLEDELSHFDQMAFIKEFKKWGEWIEVPPFAFVTSDGSHLEAAEAVEFSALLAKEIHAKSAQRESFEK